MFASFHFGIFKMAASVTALGRRTTFWRWSMRFSLFCKEQRKVYGWRSSFMLITTAQMFSGGYIFFEGSYRFDQKPSLYHAFVLYVYGTLFACCDSVEWILTSMATCFTIYQWLSIPFLLIASRFVFASTAHRISSVNGNLKSIKPVKKANH